MAMSPREQIAQDMLDVVIFGGLTDTHHGILQKIQGFYIMVYLLIKLW
jgi:hypothetical protein